MDKVKIDIDMKLMNINSKEELLIVDCVKR